VWQPGVDGSTTAISDLRAAVGHSSSGRGSTTTTCGGPFQISRRRGRSPSRRRVLATPETHSASRCAGCASRQSPRHRRTSTAPTTARHLATSGATRPMVRAARALDGPADQAGMSAPPGLPAGAIRAFNSGKCRLRSAKVEASTWSPDRTSCTLQRYRCNRHTPNRALPCTYTTTLPGPIR
jgi:hypothetical protein